MLIFKGGKQPRTVGGCAHDIALLMRIQASMRSGESGRSVGEAAEDGEVAKIANGRGCDNDCKLLVSAPAPLSSLRAEARATDSPATDGRVRRNFVRPRAPPRRAVQGVVGVLFALCAPPTALRPTLTAQDSPPPCRSQDTSKWRRCALFRSPDGAGRRRSLVGGARLERACVRRFFSNATLMHTLGAI
jgi:hypothetical protein